MHISVLVNLTLLLGLAVLLLAADHSLAGQKEGKKGRKRSQAKKTPRRKARRLQLLFDSNVESQPDVYQIPVVYQSLSISPWTYELSYDESRIPSHIFEARCESTGCINEDGKEDAGLESKPIYYQFMVLRRVKVKKNKYNFQLERHTASVGCTCVRPNVISHM